MFALSGRPQNASQKTFAQQASLARLPVPDLRASLDRYLLSLRPILLDRASRNELPSGATVDSELAQRQAWADDFCKPGGVGSLLQERLKDVDRAVPDNWLDDAYWIKAAYHSWRVPLPVNSNWWILMAHDPDVPKEVTDGVPPKDGTFGEWQMRRAAKLAWRFLDFKDRLERQDIVPDSSRAGPFDMHQYTRVFGISRVAALPTDHLVHHAFPSPSKSITVLVRDQVYTLPVYKPDGGLIPVEELEAGLWAICDNVSSLPSSELDAPVGNLTGSSRDAWTVSREHLISLSPSNRASLNAVEDSLFTLCLDDSTRVLPPGQDSLPASSSGKSTSVGLDAHIVSASANGDGSNRWFDKSFQVIVENNSRGSLNGEHSPCDALIPSIVSDYAQAEGVGKGGVEGWESVREKGRKGEWGGGWTRLRFVVDGKTEAAIAEAKKEISEIQKDSDGKMLWFDDYGADWIKKQGKQSPDAYIQMAMQLAWYREQGWMSPTYETASTRLFRKGRTDVIRTLSEDSYNFVRSMDDPSADSKKKFELLSKATAAHNKYTRDASLGKGCDRHLMGLTLVHRVSPSTPDLHPLLSDPLFKDSQTWHLSTSGLSAGDRFFGTGFGTVWPDGYGINYLAGAEVIKFGMESKRSEPKTSTDGFRGEVTRAMRDMRKVCEEGKPREKDEVGWGAKKGAVAGASEAKL